MFLGVLYIGAFLPFFNERNVRNEALKTTLFIFSKIVSQNDFKYITNGLNHKTYYSISQNYINGCFYRCY
jgi:hypothetical protein